MEAETINAQNSEEEFAHKLSHMGRACAGIIHVRTEEIWRTVLTTRRTILGSLKEQYKEWDALNGLRTLSINDTYNIGNVGDGNNQMVDILRAIVSDCNNPEIADGDALHYYCLVNPQYWWETPIATPLLQQLALLLPPSNVRLILVTPDTPPPAHIGDGTATINMNSPTYSELRTCANELIQSIDDDAIDTMDEEDLQSICYAGMGMSREAFEMYLSIGLTSSRVDNAIITAKDLVHSVSLGKTDILNKSDLLEQYQPEDMNDVGGMENLKEWTSKRSRCYSEEARSHGIEPPNGCVVVGIPGTGKSLVAKAIARELGVSLVRLDFGKVFNSLVGASEERIRTALKHVAWMAPCVLFVDEIDKGLGGIGSGGGDSGTSSRVLGSFLTWLNDNTAPVFTMVTANNIDSLPPELLRRGRFDNIFATSLPGLQERKEILQIHLRKRGWEKALTGRNLQTVANKMKGFVGAEIESTVKDALINSFAEGEQLSQEYLEAAIKDVIPLSVSHNAQIQAMTLWAKQHATPAGSREAETPDANVTQIGKRTRRPVTKKKDD